MNWIPILAIIGIIQSILIIVLLVWVNQLESALGIGEEEPEEEPKKKTEVQEDDPAPLFESSNQDILGELMHPYVSHSKPLDQETRTVLFSEPDLDSDGPNYYIDQEHEDQQDPVQDSIESEVEEL